MPVARENQDPRAFILPVQDHPDMTRYSLKKQTDDEKVSQK